MYHFCECENYDRPIIIEASVSRGWVCLSEKTYLPPMRHVSRGWVMTSSDEMRRGCSVETTSHPRKHVRHPRHISFERDCLIRGRHGSSEGNMSHPREISLFREGDSSTGDTCFNIHWLAKVIYNSLNFKYFVFYSAPGSLIPHARER